MRAGIFSRAEIESCLRRGFRSRVAVISFYTKDEKPLDFSVFSDVNCDVFQVGVEDTRLDELMEFSLTYKTYFSEAEELAKFIFAAKNAGVMIICQCEYGLSLSAGCAAAIRQFFNGDGINVFENYAYCPNLLMYHKVYNALIEESFEHGEFPCRY